MYVLEIIYKINLKVFSMVFIRILFKQILGVMDCCYLVTWFLFLLSSFFKNGVFGGRNVRSTINICSCSVKIELWIFSKKISRVLGTVTVPLISKVLVFLRRQKNKSLCVLKTAIWIFTLQNFHRFIQFFCLYGASKNLSSVPIVLFAFSGCTPYF